MALATSKVPIPDGLTVAHFQEIQKFLSQALVEFQGVDPNVQRVNSRLNYSKTDEPIPVWVGTVEAKPIQDLRPGYELGKVRFGQSNRSFVYWETVTKGGIVTRNWCQDIAEKYKPGYGPGNNLLGPQVGCMIQIYTALTTTEGIRCGTINIAFNIASQINLNRTLLHPLLLNWATEKMPYVRYLKDQFELGGPGKKP